MVRRVHTALQRCTLCSSSSGGGGGGGADLRTLLRGMAATAGVIVAGGLAIKASPALSGIIVKLGQQLSEGAACALGEVLGHRALDNTRAFLSWRPGASEGSLRDQFASEGLGSAVTFMQLAANAGDAAQRLEHVKSALDELVRAQDRVALADVLADEKMWTHQVHVHHLLVTVAYLHESRLGQDHASGLRAVSIFLPPMFDLFAQKMDWARRAFYGSDTKQQRVIDAYMEHMTVWEEQLLALQSTAGPSAVTIHREDATKMVRSVEMVCPTPTSPTAMVARMCPTCGIGFLDGSGHCSSRSCEAVSAPAVATIAAASVAAILPLPPQLRPVAGPAVGNAPATRWQWQREDGSWQTYEPHLCARMERKFELVRQGNIAERHLDIDERRERYVDLKRMVQARWSDSVASRRPIRRLEVDVWVRHTNSGRVFYRRPRNDMSTTLDPPPAWATIQDKEETGSGARWFEERWARLMPAPHPTLQQPSPPTVGTTLLPPTAPVVMAPPSGYVSGGVRRGMVLAAGDDIDTQTVTVEHAKAICVMLPGCVGFCFQSPDPNAYGQAVPCYFKSSVTSGPDAGWCTFLK
eukprot:COSAG02_NODE_1924_length_10351_cov_4.487320_14_plen_581_part_00